LQGSREKLNGFTNSQSVNGNGLHKSGYLTQYDPRTVKTKAEALSCHTKRRSALTTNSELGANFDSNVEQRVVQWSDNCRRVKQNNYTCRPLHVENVSQVYNFEGLQYSYWYNSHLVPSYHQNVQYVPQVKVSIEGYDPIFTERGHYFQQQRYDRQKHQQREQGYIKPKSHRPIVRIATISRRPGSKNTNKYKSFLKAGTKCASEKIQKIKFSNSKIEEELSGSPIFQMLCEIVRAN